MTIRRGEEWGVPVQRPADLAVVDGDAALAAHDGGPVAPASGDLHGTLGSPAADRPTMQRLDVDGLRVSLDGGAPRWAIAHVIARRSWWRGPIVAVMNVGRLGRWSVATRAHPNDGVADVLEVDPRMSLRDRWAAGRRLPSGAHVPHPRIATRRTAGDEWTFDRPLRVSIDGVEVGRARRLTIEVVADHFVVYA